jgi:hypothetical protein
MLFVAGLFGTASCARSVGLRNKTIGNSTYGPLPMIASQNVVRYKSLGLSLEVVDVSLKLSEGILLWANY